MAPPLPCCNASSCCISGPLSAALILAITPGIVSPFGFSNPPSQLRTKRILSGLSSAVPSMLIPFAGESPPWQRPQVFSTTHISLPRLLGSVSVLAGSLGASGRVLWPLGFAGLLLAVRQPVYSPPPLRELGAVLAEPRDTESHRWELNNSRIRRRGHSAQSLDVEPRGRQSRAYGARGAVAQKIVGSCAGCYLRRRMRESNPPPLRE